MRLPVYEQQVRLQGRNRTDLTVRATPNAFGAQVGAAVQDLGQGIAAVAEAKRFKNALVDDADARKALNELIDYDRVLKYDPTDGALVQTGANGLTANREAAEARLREKRAALAERLGPGARKIFEQAADKIEDDTADALIIHDAEQTRDYTVAQREATAQKFMTVALDNYADDKKWSEYVAAAIAEAEALGSLSGMPPELVAEKRTEMLRTAHSNRAIRIAYDDPIKADAYLDAHRTDLGEAEYTRLKSGMEAAVVEHKADAVIDGLAGGDGYIGPAGVIDGLGRETYIVGPESNGRTDAKNADSTAMGSVQFLADTYIEWVGRVNPAWAAGMTREEILATRADPVKEAEIYRAFRDNNLAVLAANGLPDTPRNRYVMHHFGVSGGAKLLQVEAAGQGNIPVVDIVGQDVVDVNPHIAGRTVSGALAVLQGKVNAHGAGLGGLNARAAYEAVMAIEDPKVREAAMIKLEARLKAEESLMMQDQRAASDEAWRLYTQEGMRAQDVPMDLQIKMGREATLNFFESARAYESGTLVTDENRYSELQRMAVMDPEGFAGLDLSYDRTNFSKGDFRALEQMQLSVAELLRTQEQQRQDTLSDPATIKKVYTAAEQRYNDVVPSKGARRTDAEAASFNRFMETVTKYSNDFMQSAGREMTYDEQNRLFSMLLTPVIIDEAGIGGRNSARFMDIPYREPGSTVSGDVQTGDITMTDRLAAREELAEFYGREPSEDEVTVHYNRKLLASLGVDPEMEYRDIPRDVRRKMLERHPEASDEELVDLYIEFVLETAGRE